MGIREQKIQLNFTRTILNRAVRSLKRDDKLNFETGYVTVDDIEIAVWRPVDSNDNSLDAPWHEGVWRNIYIHRLAQLDASPTVACDMADVSIHGVSVSLPKFVTDVSFGLKEHIEEQLKK